MNTPDPALVQAVYNAVTDGDGADPEADAARGAAAWLADALNEHADAYVPSNPAETAYFTGFYGAAYLVRSRGGVE